MRVRGMASFGAGGVLSCMPGYAGQNAGAGGSCPVLRYLGCNTACCTLAAYRVPGMFPARAFD